MIRTEWSHNLEEQIRSLIGNQFARVVRTSGLYATVYLTDGSHVYVQDGQSASDFVRTCR